MLKTNFKLSIIFLLNLIIGCSDSNNLEPILDEEQSNIKLPEGHYLSFISIHKDNLKTNDIEFGYSLKNDGNLSEIINYNYNSNILLPNENRYALGDVNIDTIIYQNSSVNSIIRENLTPMDYYGLNRGTFDTIFLINREKEVQLNRGNTFYLFDLNEKGKIKGKWSCRDYNDPKGIIYDRYTHFTWLDNNITEAKIYRPGNSYIQEYTDDDLFYTYTFKYDTHKNYQERFDPILLAQSTIPSIYSFKLPLTQNNITSITYHWVFDKEETKLVYEYLYDPEGYPVMIKEQKDGFYKNIAFIEYQIEN